MAHSMCCFKAATRSARGSAILPSIPSKLMLVGFWNPYSSGAKYVGVVPSALAIFTINWNPGSDTPLSMFEMVFLWTSTNSARCSCENPFASLSCLTFFPVVRQSSTNATAYHPALHREEDWSRLIKSG